MFELSPHINKDKIFLVNLSEIEGRLDPHFYSPKFTKLIEKFSSIKHTNLGSLISFSNETWNQKDIFENDFPYIEISEIDITSGKIGNIKYIPKSKAPSRAKKIVRKNDILISTTRPHRGAITLINDKYDLHIASTGFAIIRSYKHNNITLEFLYYILRQKFTLLQMEQRSSGGNYPAITEEELKKILIPLPSKEIQQQIIDIYENAHKTKQQKEKEAERLLNSIDSYLLDELGISLPEKDNSLKNRIFKVGFSELTGGRFDPHFNNIYFKEIFNYFSDSKYSILRLKDILENIKTGTTPHQRLNPFVESDGVLFLRNTNLKKNQIDLSDIKFVKKEFAKELTYSVKNEVIMCIAGTVGLSAINNIKEPISINQNVSALKFNKEKINPFFASFWFNTSVFIELTKRACSIATILYLNNDNLKSLPIPVPPLKKQNEIVEHIKLIRKKVKQLKAEAKQVMEQAKIEVEKMILN